MLVRTIRNLLYEQGFTIEGAKSQLLGEANLETIVHSSKEFLNVVITHLEQLLRNSVVITEW